MKRFFFLALVMAVLALIPVAAGCESADPQGDIDEALEVYSWFAMSPLDVDTDVPDESGEYFLVLDDRYCIYNDMDAFIRTYFSDEIATSLWGWETYKNVGGLLYARDEIGRRVDENIMDINCEITEQTDEKMVYEVKVDYLTTDEQPLSETYEFVRELIDGNWIYTSFVFYW